MGEDCSCYKERIRHEFDRACILAINGEAANYFKALDRYGKRETSFSELSEVQLGELYTVDEYSVENFFFQVLEYDIEVKDPEDRNGIRETYGKKTECNFALLLYGYERCGNCEEHEFGT